jgi:ACS family sodium-dependent inorganic phosphate cotransporter
VTGPSQALAASPRGWQTRYTVVALCLAATLVCYIDRVNISVAIIPMAKDLDWDQTTRGFVLSAFFWGYLATQIAGGWLADRYGGKIVLGMAVLVWSAFTVLTPPAAFAGFWLLILARIGMGLGEGLTFPSIYTLFARWVPSSERTRAVGLNFAGIPLGTIVALFVTPLIVVQYGWPWAFYIFGAFGLVWYAAWHFLVSDSPETHPRITEEEKAFIASQRSVKEDAPKGATRVLLSKRPVWALIFNHFCTNWGFYVLLSWLPTYMNEGLGVNIRAVGLYTALPFIANVAGFMLSGYLADKMIAGGQSVTRTRKIMQTIGLGGPAVALLLVGNVTNAEVAVAIMTVSLFLAGWVAGGFLVNHLDIAPRHAGILMGLTNTAGTLPGILGVTITGFILDATGSWALVFGVAAAIYLAGLAVWWAFATGEQIVE